MIKKLSVILISIVLMISVCGVSHAADLKTSLDIIQKASETKYLENDQGFISKTIVDSNADSGEAIIELKISNTKKAKAVTTTTETVESSEVVFVIDESGSMNDKVEDGKTRRDAVYGASEELATKILDNYSNVKIGVVKFAGQMKGSIADAAKTCELTNDKTKVLAAIKERPSIGSTTNLEAGILTAKGMYTANAKNKIMIILTDGAPNGSTREGQMSAREATKDTLITTDKAGINIITMLTEIGSQATAEAIFGTQENPTVGKYYYIADSDISTIISESIYKDVIAKLDIPNEAITKTKIVDYFPDDIMENFEFSYVGTPNAGTATDKIDVDKKSITWDIGELKGNGVATLRYKLKIKDMKNSKLLNKTIATNQKVVLTYTDKDNKNYTVELTTSPKIQLTEIKEKADANNTTDDTIATKKMPQTGESIIAIVAIVAVAGIVGFAFYKSNKFRNM